MEDSMDMDMSPLRPRNYLFSCELKADKDDHFKVDNDENEHQLSLRMVSLGAGAKDELYIVEAKAMNSEGSPIKVTLATLKMSVQPTVSLGGFEIKPPDGRARWLKPVIPALWEAECWDYRREPPRPAMKLLSMSGKQSAPGGGSKVPQKKVKLAADEDEDVDDEDNDDDFDVEETEEKVLVKKSKNPSQKQEKTPKTPKGPSSVEYIKANVQESIEKGGSLPKVEAKFINYVKNCFQMTDQEAI
ncbi:nucleophosmin-like isoform X1 [Cebus imitator]|uniref:nucleophosmin-like isoform X1 n=1 Tax=Cebus imitator TaxID=2715852 RepID=UPI00189BEDBB|nr:nucleophosmin-like isoform X1 [Cebus imitator]